MIGKGYQYTFVIQCKELSNHAESRILATMRVQDKCGEFMEALKNLNCNPDFLKQIYIGEIDL
jgi:hypothetical protein